MFGTTYWSMKRSDQAGRREVLENTSWFRATPHYWTEASLPFAYALACVEVVSRNSENAGVLYNRIVEAWSDMGMSTCT